MLIKLYGHISRLKCIQKLILCLCEKTEDSTTTFMTMTAVVEFFFFQRIKHFICWQKRALISHHLKTQLDMVPVPNKYLLSLLTIHQ